MRCDVSVDFGMIYMQMCSKPDNLYMPWRIYSSFVLSLSYCRHLVDCKTISTQYKYIAAVHFRSINIKRDIDVLCPVMFCQSKQTSRMMSYMDIINEVMNAYIDATCYRFEDLDNADENELCAIAQASKGIITKPSDIDHIHRFIYMIVFERNEI